MSTSLTRPGLPKTRDVAFAFAGLRRGRAAAARAPGGAFAACCVGASTSIGCVCTDASDESMDAQSSDDREAEASSFEESNSRRDQSIFW